MDAWTAPSATDQFALPTTSQPFMLVPSSSVVHSPGFCALTVGDETVNAINVIAPSSDAIRVIAPPSPKRDDACVAPAGQRPGTRRFSVRQARHHTTGSK